MRNKNKFYIAGGLFLIGILLVFIRPEVSKCPPEYTDLKVSGVVYNLECAITPSDRAQGLSGREGLPEDTGLLFVFENTALHRFWMKDMKFAIDIIWLDEGKRVAHIEKEVSPETYPESFGPTTDSKYVLEINAGQVKKNNIKLGDIASF